MRFSFSIDTIDHLRVEEMVGRKPGSAEEQDGLSFGNSGMGNSVLRETLSSVRKFVHGTAWGLYHIVVVALSAGIALSLP
ncbi:MAG: hypothetical protein ACREJN_09405, partial [Nitrospiraceae bacterium]